MSQAGSRRRSWSGVGQCAIILVALAGCAGGVRATVPPTILHRFGARIDPPPLGDPSLAEHPGIDFVVNQDGEVIAIADGVVARVDPPDPLFVGWSLVIFHPSINRRVIYGHFAAVAVSEGDHVG